MRAFFATIALVIALPAFAQDQSGTMTVTFSFQSVVVKQVGDFDGVWDRKTSIDQSATMTCPLMNEGISPSSYLDGPSAAQQKAQEEQGRATAADAAEMQEDGTAARMQDFEAMMKACKAKGGNDQVCGMQVMQAMQSDPAFLEGGARVGERSRAAAPKLDAAAGRFEIWHSENCTGTLTANNRVTLSKGGVVKIVETILGRRPLSNADANVVVETDLTKKSSRVWIVAPEAAGFSRTAPDNKTEAALMALPDGNIIAGPTPGGIKNGRFTKNMDGGGYKVEWVFARGR